MTHEFRRGPLPGFVRGRGDGWGMGAVVMVAIGYGNTTRVFGTRGGGRWRRRWRRRRLLNVGDDVGQRRVVITEVVVFLVAHVDDVVVDVDVGAGVFGDF